MIAKCGYRFCDVKFEKTVPWNRFHTTECKMAEWAIRKAEEKNKSALHEAQKAIPRKKKIAIAAILFFLSLSTVQVSGSEGRGNASPLGHDLAVGLASFYSTEACKFNPTKGCLTASGKSLYELEKNHVLFVASWKYPLCKAVRLRSKSVSKRMIKKIDILLSDWFGDKLYAEGRFADKVKTISGVNDYGHGLGLGISVEAKKGKINIARYLMYLLLIIDSKDCAIKSLGSSVGFEKSKYLEFENAISKLLNNSNTPEWVKEELGPFNYLLEEEEEE
jgi:hypothetical protein